ncbi:MAG: hypothetical protein H6667_01835 [Ardenticatenaceae bacterium]|nr:hypothetical protein [Ardenticatenaceae bacterium]MCB9445277.1 hypothetical protein [Ardenticatenaceae bacterium]
MSSKKETMIGDTTLKSHRPTDLKFEEVYTWTIWQFPRKAQGGFCGAAHPPLPKHGWFPAIIYVKEKKVQIHANLDQTFTTPEEAAKFLET